MASAATDRVKCKYWDKCYRKDANHKKDYLHPGDEEEAKADAAADDDVAMDASDSPSKDSTVTKRAAHTMSDSEEEEPPTKKPALTTAKSKSIIIGGSINNKKGAAATSAPTGSDATSSDAATSDATTSATSDAEKPKCKYWEKCYRKDPTHKKDFLHPDMSPTKTNAKKSKEEEEEMDTSEEKKDKAEDKVVKPKLEMKEDEEYDVGRYKIRLSAGVYSCSCRAWKNHGMPVDKRTCKQLIEALGEEFEVTRVGKEGVEGIKMIDMGEVESSSPSGASAATRVMLAHKWDEESVDPTGWWISEKLDGLRAYWDGKKFYSRLGNPFDAPKWFVQDFPKFPLDGELFGGRGKFQQTVKIVKNHASDDWKKLKYHVFDAPYLKNKSAFEDRIKVIKDHFDTHPTQYVHMIEHSKCKGRDHLDRKLDEVLSKGGEGLMIRKPKSPYEHQRSHCLLKIKKFYDAEAVVIGHEKGSGKNYNKCGALVCRMECGVQFKVGTGLSDKDRAHPPKVGSIISYKFQELTNSGTPRFPSYIGIRIDMDSPKDAVIRKVTKSDD